MLGNLIERKTINPFFTFILILTVMLLISGCNSKISPEDAQFMPKQDIQPVEKTKPLFEESDAMQVSKRNYVAGEWIAYSKGIYYDDGDFRYPETPQTVLLINDDKTWSFGSYSGRWEVSDITENDLKIWGVRAYGPKKKFTLYGWNEDIASGPIEGEATPQFIW